MTTISTEQQQNHPYSLALNPDPIQQLEECVTAIIRWSLELWPFLLARISIPSDPMGSVSQCSAIHQTTKSFPFQSEREKKDERYIGRDRIRMIARERKHTRGKEWLGNFEAAIDFNYTNYAGLEGKCFNTSINCPKIFRRPFGHSQAVDCGHNPSTLPRCWRAITVGWGRLAARLTHSATSFISSAALMSRRL